MTTPQAPLDLSTPGRYHVIGVGGPGMSAIALTLAQMGHRVSGCDVRELAVLDRLRAAGVEVHLGHHVDHVDGVDAVTASTAVPAENLELAAARSTGTTVLRRAGMLASICAQAEAVAVVGTHGKTTTTSMLARILQAADPATSFLVGGDLQDAGSGAAWGGGRWLVVEADESDGTHLELPVHAAILTNIEADHLDHYGTFEAMAAGFDAFLGQVSGPKMVCVDDPIAARLAEAHGASTYGTSAAARYRAVDIEPTGGRWHFTVQRDGDALGAVELPLRGLHNVRNATGAIALADALGVPLSVAAPVLARFGGVVRRFDVRGHHEGITLVDDYAHLPSEIAAVLEAAAASGDGWQRIVAVFQPNRYKRMATMSPEYRDAFVRADIAVIMDVYASGQTPIPGVTGKLVVDAVCAAHPGQRVVWMPDREDLVRWLARELRPGDVCISMGCGDVEALPDEILEAWSPAGGALSAAGARS